MKKLLQEIFRKKNGDTAFIGSIIGPENNSITHAREVVRKAGGLARSYQI